MVDFQLAVHEYFSKKEIYFNELTTNISKDEYFILTRFLTNKPFKVVDCGSAVISHQLYKELCLKNLNTPGLK